MKEVLWTALLTAATAFSASLAARVLDRMWRRVTHEAPPEPRRLARLLIGWPVGKAVTRSVRSDTVATGHR